jgi:branched-chain amino acid transport system substrate-binding protein
VPWQAWYYGRGAKPGNNAAFKYTYHFSFGVENFAKTYISQWHLIPTNKTVGVLLPNDSDGNAIRESLMPILKKAGFKIVDPGPYEDGTNDYSAQIAKYKAAKCEIFNTFPLPPDFATFWKQAAQQGYKPKIAQIAKTGLFPSQVEALGALGPGLATGAFWHPAFPYGSSLTGLKGKAIQDSYESKTGKQWTQVLGSGLALFDAAAAALKAASDPKDKAAVTKAISTLRVDTPVGHLDWTKGPVKNAVHTVIPGCQWVSSKPGSKFKLDLVMTEHADDPNIPIQAKLKPYGSKI